MNIIKRKLKSIIAVSSLRKHPETLLPNKVLKNKTSNVLINSKTLEKEYTNQEIQIIILKILNNLTQKLLVNKVETNCIRLYISYSDESIPSLKFTLNLAEKTNSYSKIIKTVIKNYNLKVYKKNSIKKIGISFTTIN